MKDSSNDQWSILKSILSNKAAPFASGAASIKLLGDALNSKLPLSQYYVAVGSSLFVFTLSVIAFCYLSRIEKNKDVEMLTMVKRIIEAVYKHFGVAMANRDAAETAKIMNPIMQTIVNLVKEFQKLADKNYKD